MNKQRRRKTKFVSFINLSINPNEEIDFETPKYTVLRDRNKMQNLLNSYPFIFFKYDNLLKNRIDMRNALKFWTKKSNIVKNYINQMQATNNKMIPLVTNQSSPAQNSNTENNNKADDNDHVNIVVQNETNDPQRNDDTSFNLLDNTFSGDENNDFDDFDDFDDLIMDGFFT